jgi:hypothetical protein
LIDDLAVDRNAAGGVEGEPELICLAHLIK